MRVLRRLAAVTLFLPFVLSADASGQIRPTPATGPQGEIREIMNPYFLRPVWKLWYEDAEPVTIERPHFSGTFQPTPVGKREFPVFTHSSSRAIPTFKVQSRQPASVAGCWDDCYMSLDRHHTRLSKLNGQFIDGGAQRNARDVQTRFELGVNFTSQSYSHRGRHIVDDLFSNIDAERHFFFANCVRATPAHSSYRDVNPAKVIDLYDGLFGHCYQSVGQSGSEINALHKMMLAGACMPRAMKNLLKKHGAYASALLTIFKASLPYSDGQGKSLPYANELRHRPAYSSSGDIDHPHYCSANLYYHGYDDQAHIRNMLRMAHGMKMAPPVTIMNLLSLSVSRGGKTIVEAARKDERLKSVTLTNMRIWGKSGETLTLRVGLNHSYDLQKAQLTLHCLPVYPQQKNVSIEAESLGVYRITVKHDPKLPKGRIPVICYATNGAEIPGNPTFVNFYWAEEGELSDYSHVLGSQGQDDASKGLEPKEVTRNLRPVVDTGLGGDAVFCKPGQEVSIEFKARDPEGYPVTIYRWAGEVGAIESNRFSMQIPQQVRERIYKLHFVFSDGTGGYSGRRIKLLVCPAQGTLPDGWAATTLGSASWVSPVTIAGQQITFAGRRRDSRARDMRGSYVFRQVTGDQDMVCELTDAARSEVGLVVCDTLDDISPRAIISAYEKSASGAIRGQVARWNARETKADAQLATPTRYLRLIKRGQRVSLYISADRNAWEQVAGNRINLGDVYYAGVLYSGGMVGEDGFAGASCAWLAPQDGPSLPSLRMTSRGRPDKDGCYSQPVEISVAPPAAGAICRFTVDGSEPQIDSPQCNKSVKLTKPGRHVLKVRAFIAAKAGQTAMIACTLKAPAKPVGKAP